VHADCEVRVRRECREGNLHHKWKESVCEVVASASLHFKNIKTKQKLMNRMKKKQYKKPVTVVIETKLDSLLYEASVPYGGPGDGKTPDDAKKSFFDKEEYDDPLHRNNYWDVFGAE